ncbi:MAG: putative 7-carboxy-7-deazaguanine synthase QueE [Coriobacteriia bacterium]|nr:putative 7-carboxy-7-deazaguanine synthase QueE [Coriobacteriia bacterium]
MPVVERFVSVNGEGLRAGQLAAFIRLKGCNLHCSYCDTTWANEADCPCEQQTVGDLVDWVRSTGVQCVTLTGGEPLLHHAAVDLIGALLQVKDLWVEVETNGTVDLAPAAEMRNRYKGMFKGGLHFTMDVKMPGSGEWGSVFAPNFKLLQPDDVVKMVVGDHQDLGVALDLIKEHEELRHRNRVLLSPVFGRIEPADIVEFMKRNDLTNVRLQLQMHKVIWPPDARGV